MPFLVRCAAESFSHEPLNPGVLDHRNQIEITGSAARKFQMIFADDWSFATQEKLLAPQYSPPPECGEKLLVQPMTDGPDNPSDPLGITLVWMLNIAGHLVWADRGLLWSQ